MDGGPCAAGTGSSPACVDVELALAFVDGALPAPARAEVERRIDGCARCRGVVAAAARGASASPATVPDGSMPPTHAEGARRRPASAPRKPAGEPAGLAPGEVVGRYVVERALGAGGMGVVCLARDPELRRAVVIKLVRGDLDGEAFEARLRREAQAMAQLSHPNVVQIFDIGRHGERVFLAMEFVPGRTLDAWLIERPRTPAEILAMFRQAGAGLDAAHRAGIVHRDFKPSNVLVGGDGVAKVTDFGLARGVLSPASLAAGAAGAGGAAAGAPPRPSGVHAVLTRADAVVGTPAYMSPEQTAGQPLDARTDQYTFALVLLDALVGQSPVRRRVHPSHGAGAVDAALAAAGIEPPVRAAIARALHPDPAARFAGFGELLAALAPPRPPGPERRRWPWLAGVAFVVAAAGGAAAVALRRGPAECVAEAPRRWPGEAREARVQALAGARPFASWTRRRIAGALEVAVERLAAAELAVCRETPGADAACVARRRRALERAMTALAGRPALDDAWAAVRDLDRCDEPPPGDLDALAGLRRELRAGPTASRARALAERARTLGDDLLAADAHAAAAAAAFAAGDPGAAEPDLRAQAAAGERAKDDAARARALIRLLDVAGWRGDLAAARRDDQVLRAILGANPVDPRDELAVSMAEGAAFTAAGDLHAAAAAWDRALAAAGALRSADARLRARAGRAWTRHLRFDAAGARDELAEALAEAGAAGAAARAEALIVQGDLALARAGDRAAGGIAEDAPAAGAAALSAFRTAHALAPARAAALADRIRVARARALAGEVDPDAALAELAAIAPADDAAATRLRVARGQILLAAGRGPEALAALSEAAERIRPLLSSSAGRTHAPLPLAERFEALLARCDAERRAARYVVSCGIALDLIDPLVAPSSPLRARAHLANALEHPELKSLTARSLGRAIEVLTGAGAPGVVIAELRWEVARLGDPRWKDDRAQATAARDELRTAGRLDEVREIDAWLAGGGGSGSDP